MPNLEMKVHGTYPFDFAWWKTLKELTPVEAVDLVGASPEVKTLAEYATETQRAPGFEPRRFYPWLNKGFILIGAERDFLPLPSEPISKMLKPGMQAVYLHDGHFTLIEVVR